MASKKAIAAPITKDEGADAAKECAFYRDLGDQSHLTSPRAKLTPSLV